MPETNDVTLDLICPAERARVGKIDGAPGAMINASYLRTHLVSNDWVNWSFQDGQLLICPMCGNALVAGLPEQSISDAIRDNLRLVVNFFRLPDPSRPRRYFKGDDTLDPLRAQPIAMKQGNEK